MFVVYELIIWFAVGFSLLSWVNLATKMGMIRVESNQAIKTAEYFIDGFLSIYIVMDWNK